MPNVAISMTPTEFCNTLVGIRMLKRKASFIAALLLASLPTLPQQGYEASRGQDATATTPLRIVTTIVATETTEISTIAPARTSTATETTEISTIAPARTSTAASGRAAAADNTTIRAMLTTATTSGTTSAAGVLAPAKARSSEAPAVRSSAAYSAEASREASSEAQREQVLVPLSATPPRIAAATHTSGARPLACRALTT
jgi:hypothetical protein